jgi:hypothetical protein
MGGHPSRHRRSVGRIRRQGRRLGLDRSGVGQDRAICADGRAIASGPAPV